MADSIAYGILCVVLIAAAVTDWRRGIVPNRLTVPAIVAGLLLAAVAGYIEGGWQGATDRAAASFLAMLAGLIPMALIFFVGGIGGGDVKIVAAVGAISGSWICVLHTCFYAFVVMAIMALVIMLRHRIFWRTIFRLVSAALTAAAKVKPVIPGDSPKVPFAIAVCVGGILAGAEQLLHLKLFPWSFDFQ